jgi:hypothetical protein
VLPLPTDNPPVSPPSTAGPAAIGLWTTPTAAAADFSSVVLVSYIEVDPQVLAQTGTRLRDAVTVATEVSKRKGELAALAASAGHEPLGDTVAEFMSRWAHGLGCLVEDATTLASMLTDAGRVYVDVETEIAQAAGGTR